MLETWRISKSKNACFRCSADFAQSGVIFSSLIEEAGGFARRDFCPDCWEQSSPGGFFCFWRTRRPAEQKKRAVDTQLLVEFFERLEGAEAEKKKAFRFVLALYLMRRKELKLLEIARSEAGETLVCRRRSSGDRVEVANPGLTEDQIQDVAGQLTQLLDANL